MSQEILINGKAYEHYHVTGRVTGASKHLETQVSGGGGGGYSYQGTGSSYSAPVTSRTFTHDQVFVAAGDGKEHALKLVDWDLAVREGHDLTAVWLIKRGKSSGPYVAIQNHTTGDVRHNMDALAKMHRPPLYFALAPLLLVNFLPGTAIMISLGALVFRWWTGKSRAKALVARGDLLSMATR
jgi:hypothetical protein